ncbi:mycofactocin biosynthesis peptidyl-dipeptidase MftE [Subtercola vilae]|uniref:mycofactocin biosynthesis peptidyl-dipeptidase MftE n=1 Tax=Subtercola vilae TaxID=2056433 RepID=UPI001EEF0E5C|nr:mycofactocin biosynthesis peptidyl-dipeptidase MftE [Subtercola vilae]
MSTKPGVGIVPPVGPAPVHSEKVNSGSASANLAPADLAGAVSPAVNRGSLVLVPLGSTEQHGPHLPLSTDSIIATRVAHAVAHSLSAAAATAVVVAPTLHFGSSGEHQSFAGTVSIGTDALRFVLVELVRSLSTWAGRVVFVNGHGGNVAALVGAVVQLRSEGHDVAWLPCATALPAPGTDTHAGRVETSLLLHLAPELVHLDRAEAGVTLPLASIMAALAVGGVAAVSPNGILGDPAGADAAEGARLFAAIVATAHDLIDRATPTNRGRLE